MDIGDWLNLVAIIVAPIAAVLIGQRLQTRAEKRKDKLEVFKALMIARNGWNPESVRALNIIDIVYADDSTVRQQWKEYYDRLCIENPSDTDLKKIKEPSLQRVGQFKQRHGKEKARPPHRSIIMEIRLSILRKPYAMRIESLILLLTASILALDKP